MAANNQIMIRIGAQAGGAQKAGMALRKAAIPAAAALGAMGLAAKAAISDASDLSESLNKTSVVFGKSATGIESWADTASTAMGLAKADALDMAANLGGMFQDAGKSAAEAAKLSQALIQRSADLGSMFNVDPTQASEKLQAALRGEYEGARALNLQLSDAVIKQFAYKKGIAATGSELTEAQKVQARYGVIMERSSRAAGDFSATSDGVANSQRILAAEFTNLKADLGQALLPVVEKALGMFKGLMSFAKENTTAFKVLAAGAALVAGGILAANAAMKIYAISTKAAEFATKLFNGTLKANPIGIVVTAVSLLVGALVSAYASSENFRGAVNSVFDKLKELWDFLSPIASTAFEGLKAAFEVLSTPMSTIITAATDLYSAAEPVLSLLKKVVAKAFDGLSSALGVLRDPINTIRTAFSNLSSFASPVIEVLKGVARGAFSGLKTAFGVIAKPIQLAANAIMAIYNAIKKVRSVWDWFVRNVQGSGKNPFAPGGPLAPEGRSRSTGSTLSLQGRRRQTITVQVPTSDQMVLDEEMVARALQRLLLRSDARNGRALYV
jgi:hypothetical protein